MTEYEDAYSLFDTPGFDPSFIDLLGIIRNSPRQSLQPSFDMLDAIVVSPSSFDLNVDQKPSIEQRYAGEGAESNTFIIPTVAITASFNIPLQIPATQYIDPAFALLWDYCKLALWGTAGVIKSRLSTAISIGDSALSITNISDFVPFIGSAKIIENGVEEDVVINDVDKATRIITLDSGVSSNYTTGAQIIAYLPRSAGIEREPAFSLLSLREGFVSPCLVNKIELNIKAGEEISASVEVMAINIDREQQITIKPIVVELADKQLSTLGISQILNGSIVRISPATTATGTYAMESVLGDNLLSGFQTLDLPLNLITGISITIDNKLKNIYCLHSIDSDTEKKRRENSFPFALVSEGRVINGSITYKHPADPFTFAEKIAGPAGLGNNGLVISMDTFKITMPEIIWSPSTSKSEVGNDKERTLNWFMGAQTFNSMPILETI